MPNWSAKRQLNSADVSSTAAPRVTEVQVDVIMDSHTDMEELR